jgi:site-specific DNA recombinase
MRHYKEVNCVTKKIRKVMQSKPPAWVRMRVCAYARVSSKKDAMLHSLSAQVSYYSGYIQKNPYWEYAGVYVDRALTGTKDNRADFQRMIADCRAGKIDMIITKSIARFARNTVTLLETVRELKALGIDVYFEEQNIHSLSEGGELMLSILASYAQEESLNVSECCKWRIRKNYESGAAIPILTYGYSIVKGIPEINPDEAAVVRLIFEKHLQGMGLWSIVQMMDSLGIKPPYAQRWGALTIRYILRNERYVGDLLLQKTFISDHLSKKKRINRGELPRYYVSDAYPAIISREIFERSRQLGELNAERFAPTNARAHDLFSGMVICASCGKPYKRKVAHERAAWNCGTFLRKGKAYCHGKQIPEDTLLELTEAVLGERSFEAIEQILVPKPNHLRYIFKDGNEIDRSWRDRSRRESWNEDMRRQAAEHTSRRWAK